MRLTRLLEQRHCSTPDRTPHRFSRQLAAARREQYVLVTMETHPAQPLHAARAAQRYLRVAPVTNFYPNYGGEVRTERIAPIQAARFQEIIPRYNLSTSETRTQGTGPDMYDMPSGWSTQPASGSRLGSPGGPPTSAPGRGGRQGEPGPITLKTAAAALAAYRHQVSFRPETEPQPAAAPGSRVDLRL